MGKIRRGGFVFLNWVGDHGHHVHIYRKGKQVLKWDLEENKAIQGKETKRILKLIKKLRKERRL